MELPTKGHFETSHFERVSSSWRLNSYRKGVQNGVFLLGCCPFLGGSFVEGSTVANIIVASYSYSYCLVLRVCEIAILAHMGTTHTENENKGHHIKQNRF